MDHFSTGPGSDKVKAEEYLLFNSLDSSQIVLQARTEGLMPGMSITMAFIIGRHGPNTLGNCPRAGCVSKKIKTSEAGGKFWSVLQAQSSHTTWLSRSLFSTLCRCWFNSTDERIALPQRPESTPSETDTTGDVPQNRLRQERHGNTDFNREDIRSSKDRLEEERAFKNILIKFTELRCTEPGCGQVFNEPHKLK